MTAIVKCFEHLHSAGYWSTGGSHCHIPFAKLAKRRLKTLARI